jgi:putative ABC transport system permease protein
MQDDPALFGAYDDAGFTMSASEGPEMVFGAQVTQSFFDVLDVPPVIGRHFTVDDDFAAIISHEFWQSRLSGTSNVLERSLELDGNLFSIVGVLPSNFQLPWSGEGEVYTLLRINEPPRRGPFYLRTLVRVDGEVDTESFRGQLSAVGERTKSLYPQGTDEWRYTIRPLKEAVVGDAGRTLMLLFAVVGCVLLIAIANVANLELARGTAREGEVALRSALGANRNRLVRQMLTESAVLGMIGAALGLLLAWIGAEALGAAASAFIPRMESVSLDNRVLVFALTVGLLSGLFVGVVPAISMSWKRLNTQLGAARRGSGAGTRRSHLRRALVITEFALALMVLLASGLLLRSLIRMQSAELGFDQHGVVAFRIALPADPYSGAEEFDAFFAHLEHRLTSGAGISSVGYGTGVPPDRYFMANNYTVQGQEPAPGGVQPVCPWVASDENYFETLGIALKRGRTFDETDRAVGVGSVVVNEAFERSHFPGESAVGKRLKGGAWNPDAPWLTIVGVVGDVSYRGIREESHRTVYIPYAQAGRRRTPWVMIRHELMAETVIQQIRREIVTLDSRVPMHDVWTLDQLVRESTATGRSLSTLFSVLALVALVLAATGIYGVIAYHVNIQRRDIAIRQALGSPRAGVVGRVLREGLALAAIGVVLGSGGAYMLARGMSSLLYGTSPTDITSYVGTALLLTATAFLACLIPSVRASRADPVAVLRED